MMEFLAPNLIRSKSSRHQVLAGKGCAPGLRSCPIGTLSRSQRQQEASGCATPRPAAFGKHRPRPAFCGEWPVLAFVLRRSYQEDSGAWLINQVGSGAAMDADKEGLQ